MSAARLASRYAKSLIDLGIDKGQLEDLNNDVQHFNKALENRDLWLLIKSPIVNSDKKLGIIKRVFADQNSAIMSSFLDIVVRKRREFYLPEIMQEFVNQYKSHKKVASATLTTAAPVDEQTLENIKQIVLSDTGMTTVELETAIDESLIGGFVLKFDNKLYDNSIAHKLDKLQKSFDDKSYTKSY